MVVVVMKFNSRCFSPMLRYIRHLLLLSEHLNLHLLLLGQRHEVIEYIAAAVAVMRGRHIFSLVALAKVKLGTICRAISSVGVLGEIGQVRVACRGICRVEV